MTVRTTRTWKTQNVKSRSNWLLIFSLLSLFLLTQSDLFLYKPKEKTQPQLVFTSALKTHSVWTAGVCELTNALNERNKNKSGMLHCKMSFVDLFLT